VISGKNQVSQQLSASTLSAMWHWHYGVDVSYPWLSDWTRLQWALCS